MIVCRSCGGHNADTDDFCGSCGEFLEWTGEKLAPESAQSPAPQPLPPAEPTPTAPQPPPTELTRMEPARAEPPPTEPVGGTNPAVTPSKPVGADVNPAGPAVWPVATEPPPRAVQALVAPRLPVGPDPIPPARPSPDPGPGARKPQPQPQQMRPQAPVRKRSTAPPVPAPPTRQPQPDDLICGMCGEGNPPTRRFCSRCGESLQTATVVPTPWWRRILRLFERKAHPVGARPKRRSSLLTLRGISAAIRRVLLVALLLAGLSYALFPSLRGSVNTLVSGGVGRIVSSLGQEPVPVRPIRISANAELPGHPATSATDLDPDRFWAAPAAGAQPTLIVEFEHPTRLVRAIVHNGGGADFQALNRPHDLHLVYFDGTRIIGASDAVLTDVPDQQQVELHDGDGATRVEIQVVSVYSSPQSPGLALSEIEFFERQ